MERISNDLAVYRARGFEVLGLHADNEFECLRNEILPVELDICSMDAHVPEVERSIRTTQDCL